MDLILINGKIITMDAEKPIAQAAAVKDKKFILVGNNDEVLLLKQNDTKVIDLEGKLLVPGFNDSHMHLLSYGASLQKADLTGTKSIDDLIKRTRDFMQRSKIKPGQWVLGRGWNQDYFDTKIFPTKYDLDKISTTHPICLSRACCHVCIVNSKALEIAGITKNTPIVEGGHFDIDENGDPLGIFRENAQDLIYDKISEPDMDEIKAMILNASNMAVKQGITSVQTDDFGAVTCRDFRKITNAYDELQNENSLPLRVYQQCLLPDAGNLNNFLSLGFNTGKGNDFYKIGPLKLLVDGSLGARTAYLCEPYEDDPTTVGIPVYTQDELDELVITAHNTGMQVAIHCIGDKAAYMAFESIEKAQIKNPRQDARHSIVHCQITDEVLLDKFKEMDVVALIQPIFLDYDLHMAESRIGKKRVTTSYNWKGMINRGVHIACGSDCPVEPFNVLPGIYTAVTRKDLRGVPEDGWFPEQRLTVYEALYGFTTGAAYASFEEDIKGSITPGKLADMVVLSEDIFEINPDSIKDVEVLMTFVGGKLVYEK